MTDTFFFSRLGRPTLGRRPPRPPDFGRALARHSRVDRRRDAVDRQHGRRAVAHLWRDPRPRARGLPRDARRAHDAAAAPAQLLSQQPRHGCAAELRHHPEPDCRQQGRRGGCDRQGEHDGFRERKRGVVLCAWDEWDPLTVKQAVK